MFSCQICEIFQNTYLEEHLRTTASKHRSSFLEVFCRSCCSALINAVMKYNFSAAVVQSWRVLHGNLLKIALHHRYFSKNFTRVAEQRYWKMYLDGCFWGQIFSGNIPAWLLLKSSCRRIYVLEILTHILLSYFDIMLKRNGFLWFFLSKRFGEKCKHTELALNFIQKKNFS